jgi:hypothetical protein
VRWVQKIVICTVALVFLATKGDARDDSLPSGNLQYMEPYIVEGLALGTLVVPESWQYKRFNCRPSNQYANSIWCNFSEMKGGVSKALTIMHLSNNIVTYINKQLTPALLTNEEVSAEIARLSRQFNSPAHIYRSPQRPGFPSGVIATWGSIKLQPLTRDDLAVLAEGKSPQKGVLADFLMNFHESAKAGLPVYSLGGADGYVWIARFDETGKGELRFFAADPSRMTKIEEQPDYQSEPPQSAPPASNGDELKRKQEELWKAEAEAKKAEERRLDAEIRAKKEEERRLDAETRARSDEQRRIDAESRAKNEAEEQEKKRRLQEARDHGFSTYEVYQDYLDKEKRLNESGITLKPK